MIYYTSDTHFGHKKIINYENRPFKNEEEMNQELIKKWNSKVKTDDHIYILGDVVFKDAKKILKELNGHKHLIIGNHDGKLLKDNQIREVFDTIDIYKEIKDGDNTVILFHYPIAVWDKMQYGAYHLYGHIHSRMELVEGKLNDRAFNVGTDVNDYEPKTLKELIKLNKKC